MHNLISMTQAANMYFCHATRLNDWDILITGRNITIDKLYNSLVKSNQKVFKLNKFALQLHIPENRKEEFNNKGKEWEFEFKW